MLSILVSESQQKRPLGFIPVILQRRLPQHNERMGPGPLCPFHSLEDGFLVPALSFSLLWFLNLSKWLSRIARAENHCSAVTAQLGTPCATSHCSLWLNGIQQILSLISMCVGSSMYSISRKYSRGKCTVFLSISCYLLILSIHVLSWLFTKLLFFCFDT